MYEVRSTLQKKVKLVLGLMYEVRSTLKKKSKARVRAKVRVDV